MNINILTDAQLLIAFFNFVTGLTNIIWSFQLRNLKNDGEIIKELKESNKDKEELLCELEKDKERWRTQYHSLLNKFKHLEGRIKVYQDFQNKLNEAQESPKVNAT